MSKLSFPPGDDNNDNTNISEDNIGYPPHQLNEIIDKLKHVYDNNDKMINKVEQFKIILNHKDILLILNELSERNMENIAFYILSEFSITTNDEDKEKIYLDLYLRSIRQGQIKILEALDKLELNLMKMLDKEENTGLILSVIYSDIQIAKFFLKRCPEMLEQPNKHGYTPLLLSVYNNDNLMFFLLANNLLSPISDGNSLCELAIRNENIDILNYLNPELNKDKCIYTPSNLLLHFACCQNNIDIFNAVAQMVKVYDHQISSSLETPLHWAVMRGNYHIVKTLVQIYKDKQIEIDQKNVYGVTPFYLANIRQDKHICQVLFDNGADANESDKEGNTIAHVVSSLGDLKWLKYIIKHFNVNYYMKNEKGDSPFMMAVLNENVDVVEYYIELFKSNKNTLSANLDWKNKYSQTPLHAAVFTGNITIIKLLLANKAKIHITDVNELTPYHYAYIEDKEDVIKVIHEMLGVDKVPYINFK